MIHLRITLILLALGTSAAATENPQDIAKLCWLQKAEYYAENSCDPAPFLVGAVIGACGNAEEETFRQSLRDPLFKDIPLDRMRELMNGLRASWEPRIEARIVDTRIQKGLCR